MAGNIVHPESKYKITNVGADKPWSFKDKKTGDDVTMIGYDVQMEGIQSWVTVNQKPDTAAPTVGQELEGHIEDGNFGLVFKKANKGNWGGGGSRDSYSPGAIYSAAMSTATAIVVGWYQASGTKPVDVNEMFQKIVMMTPVVQKAVESLAGTSAPAPAAEPKKEEPQANLDGSKPIELSEIPF